MRIKKIWIIQKTQNRKNANTDGDFRLEVKHKGQLSGVEVSFPNQPQDERERHSAEIYDFDVKKDLVNMDINSDDDVFIRTRSGDGWKPSHFFVIGLGVNDRYYVMGAHPEWDVWFDLYENPAGPHRHKISGYSLPND